ncbi:MAG: MFS transporter [Alphaproteobacteria bacterium]|nr:MFS transporter [Alphaproteobacteria bacterium]
MASTTTSAAAFDALNERPLSPRQRFATGLVAAGEFIDGYDLLVMGAALIYLRPQFNLSPSELGLLGASTFIGAILGLLVFGDLSDRIGRRAIFIVNLFFFVVFAIASALVETTTQLFVMRFLVGVGVGMDIPTSTAYLAEVAPRRQRGAILGSLLNMMWVLGAMTSTLLALPLTAWFGDDAWRWMLGLGAVPAVLILFGRQMLPESPRWLVSRGRTEEARAAFAAFGITARDEDLVGRKREGSYAELLRPPLLRRTALVSVVFLLNCFSGSISTIATPLVLRTVGALSVQTTLLFSATVWMTAFAGTIASSFLIDRIGRRKLCYVSVIPFGIIALVLSAFSAGNPVVLVVGFYAISFATWIGIAVLVWVWASELFPTHLRGRSQGICNGFCRLAIAGNIYLVPIALAGVCFSTYIALLSIPMFTIAVLVMLFPDFEGSQKGLEDLAASAGTS